MRAEMEMQGEIRVYPAKIRVEKKGYAGIKVVGGKGVSRAIGRWRWQKKYCRKEVLNWTYKTA